MNKLFNINWEKQEQYSDENGPIYVFIHKDFGILKVSEYALFGSKQIPENNDYIIQSILREYFLKKQNLIICIESEKLKYTNYAKSICKTLEEIQLEFPKNIIDKQTRTLLNLKRIQSDYGKFITEINGYDCFSRDNYETIF
ncbi:hypothetical protein LFX25_19985 [Leptospira sp. FAT2]|uniref:hypothetical protein n=1 Tax=Leptospira sanjuanensis TaxID=2879643 RepID=UPI001EE8C253|nr:hypothetical protein [Leptospira sanjuanensis]MCG6195525.1 hypothetical protein [Leptospira sanjuanensis]